MAGTENNGTEPTATAEAIEAEQPQGEDAEQAQPEPVTKADLDAFRAEQAKGLKDAHDAARRAENKADISRRFSEEKITRLEAQLDELAVRDMPEDQRKAHALERQVAALREQAQPASNPQQEFGRWSSEVLTAEGFDTSQLPPELNAAWENRAKSTTSPSEWNAALYGAIADYRKVEAKKAQQEAGDRERKAREDERTKIQNTTRTGQGRVDRGGPASVSGKPVSEMTPEEFDADLVKKGYRPLTRR